MSELDLGDVFVGLFISPTLPIVLRALLSPHLHFLLILIQIVDVVRHISLILKLVMTVIGNPSLCWEDAHWLFLQRPRSVGFIEGPLAEL